MASGDTDGPSAQQSLGQILEAAVSMGSRTLEVQLDSLMAALHAQVGQGREWGVRSGSTLAVPCGRGLCVKPPARGCRELDSGCVQLSQTQLCCRLLSTGMCSVMVETLAQRWQDWVP